VVHDDDYDNYTCEQFLDERDLSSFWNANNTSKNVTVFQKKCPLHNLL